MQRQAAQMLVEEASSRSSAPWRVQTKVERRGPVVVLALQKQLGAVLTPELLAQWQATTSATGPHAAPEGYTIASLQHGRVLVIAGADERGELFGAGWLLRHWHGGSSPLPRTEAFFSAPEKPVRGYQIGYRMKNNTYDAWTLAQFEQQLRDLAVFGMNTMQVVAPNSDDAATSPLFHLPPKQVVVELSRMSARYGLRFDLYYPEMADDYSDPAQVERELRQFEALIATLPQVDSIHIPGGDPGHTAPELLFPLVEREAAILRRYHPHAQVWISAQGFTAERFDRFYALLAHGPAWLTGVFFGPQSRDGMDVERARIPAAYPLEFYPDIGHTMHAQFPISAWDPVFALTEGREPICPRPEAFSEIYRHFAALNSGFVLYSEGVNDDVNKFLWAALGWNGKASPHTVLQEYAGYLLHAGTHRDETARAIQSLEENWSHPLLDPASSIAGTHAVFLRLSATLPETWRWNSLLYRDAYDRYLQLRRARALQNEREALQLLQSSGPATERVWQAGYVLAHGAATPEEMQLHARLLGLSETLFHQVGLQLSVTRYGAANWERGANVDRIDTPLNDAAWLRQGMGKATAAATEEQRSVALLDLAHWQTPAPGGFYDDLGDSTNEPHLVRGTPWQTDPERYAGAIDGIADRTLAEGWRMSWLSYAETLYETPLTLHYDGLDRHRTYTLRMTYAGEDYALPMEILANGRTVEPLRQRRSNPEILEVPIPAEVTRNGSLTVQWKRKHGAGGSGRGGQVAEVWLLPGDR